MSTRTTTIPKAQINPTGAPAGVVARPVGVPVRSPLLYRVVTFLMVFGPGLIVMEADNDAGAVSTYVQAGAQYGTHLLWLLFLLLPICYFIQEMVVRLGIATGKGHAAIIYERFGTWWGRFSLFDLLLVNFLTLVTEFAAISLATSQMGLDARLAVPLSAVALVAIVITGSYRRWERFTVVLCLLDIAWFVLARHAHHGGTPMLHDVLVPHVPPGGVSPDLVFLVIAIVGTTIAPWQLFFQQSAVADKRLRFADLPWARLDTLIGATFTVAVAGAMMLVGDAGYRHHLPFTDPAALGTSLAPILGPAFRTGLLLLMCNAAVLGTTAISLASAWAYAEVRESGGSLEHTVAEAPQFYGAYAACVGLAAGLVLIPGTPLNLIIIGVQVLAGVMLPSAVIFLQLLLNDKELLGERFVNRPWNNAVNWTIIVALFVLSLVLAAQQVAPNLFPSSAG
ncbi:MAG TPA: NRAMP family divalent metal transporter [Gemmatimonadaceae bacterium]|nr:NRAMP family divalent metal transporter [Gemmatimonadaceae bacterium]